MSNLVTNHSENRLPTEKDFQDLFAELDELDPFDIKKDELAARLTALLSFSDETRSSFAQKFGWQKSQVTALLNGKRNPTFKTVWEFARNLGYEADLTFRKPDEAPARQPWQLKTISQQNCTFKFQTPREVALDLKDGNHSDCYVAIKINLIEEEHISQMFAKSIEFQSNGHCSIPTTRTKYFAF